ncbi:SMC family ATPase [Nocardioides fonticola]|uniref:Nuclease SbcCD subunit C n=1 Tax=Nocardioides fonticola TaxID=450363 RepID=A0ABP7XV30_9ACTN
MRLHHLSITAFGPFADTVDLDLDHVSGAGLFLLSGATGAGKTSILDAICFALYGDVPGDRATAKRLRCDQAAPSVRPRVELDCTLGGRRFRIVRTPSWERPKKRGTGMTTEQASVSVSEHLAGDWSPLTTRLDEAGDLIAGLLGMNLGQFTQVALLPQGRFQAFLRARADERHALLQRLFRTGRFEDVEKWLRERRLTLGRRSAEAMQEISVLVGRISEAADEPLPPTVDDDLTEVLLDGSLRDWVHERRAAAAAGLHAVTDLVAGTAAAEASSRERTDRVRQRVEAAREVVAARCAEATLVARAEHIADLVERIRAARRAAPVVPMLQRAEADRRTADHALREARSQVRLLADAPDGAEPTGLEHELADGVSEPLLVEIDDRRRALADRLAGVRAALPRHEARRTLADDLRSLEERIAAAVHTEQIQRHREEAMPALLADAEAQVATAREAGAQVAVLQVRHDELAAVVAAGAELALLRPQVQEATDAWLAAREAAATAHETLLALREARIAGMAAELAGALVVGHSCPVCGSHEHPAKATPAPDASDASAERAAQRRVDDAKNDEHLRHLRLSELQQRVASLEATVGDRDVTAARAECAELAAALPKARTLADTLPAAEDALAALRADRDALAGHLSVLRTEIAALTASRGARAEEAARLDAEVAGLLADLPDDTLPAAERRLASAVERHEAAVAALRTARDRAAEAAASAAHVERLLAETGFCDEAAVREVAAPGDVLIAWEAEQIAHQRETDRVHEIVERLGQEHPDLAAASDPDAAQVALAEAETALAESTAAHTAALDALGRAREEAGRATARCGRLVELVARFDEELASWVPLHHDHDRTTRLSAFVEGKSADNRLQMRLSAYVLAYRLAQVVDAANERLHAMTDHRYRLEHTAERGNRESRGGLGLLVRDDWSGEARDPATLSGGETFVVSLALALGLADVIAHEVGGAAIDTLFVDEGFGSLDADTLDDVMDTLDALRDGGRVVGVVSHVAEMRSRIPTQIVVTKARSGSTAEVRVGKTFAAMA